MNYSNCTLHVIADKATLELNQSAILDALNAALPGPEPAELVRIHDDYWQIDFRTFEGACARPYELFPTPDQGLIILLTWSDESCQNQNLNAVLWPTMAACLNEVQGAIEGIMVEVLRCLHPSRTICGKCGSAEGTNDDR
jgi:hypothetical protein